MPDQIAIGMKNTTNNGSMQDKCSAIRRIGTIQWESSR